MLRVAVGAAAGLLVAGLLHGGGHKPKTRPQTRQPRSRETGERKRVSHQQRRNDSGSSAAAAAGDAVPAPAAGSAAEVFYAAVPRGRIYLLLLLQALASAAAVVWAQPLRPPNIAPNDWQHLVSLLACSAMVLSLAGAWRHYQQVAAGGVGMAGWLTPAAAQQQRGLQGQQQQQQQQQGQQQAAPLQNLTGVYVKDKAASDSLDDACDVMRLGGLVRMAIGLIKGVEVRQDDGMFTFVLHSGILWFKVTEKYAQDGRAARFKRRDLRRGTHVGRVERSPTTGGWLLHIEWGDPLGGHGSDHFYLVEKDVLHVDATLTVGGQTVRYRQVYRKVR